MKLFSFIILMFLLALAPDLASVRQKYVSAATSEQSAEELHDMLKGIGEGSSNNTLVAYKAASLTLKAKYTKGLLGKKNLFTEGATLLEAVIKRDPSNYEARLVRLNIQEHAPKITGYNKKINEDKAFLIKNYDDQPGDLKLFAKNFVKVSSSFTKEEKASFN